jgi:antitoxin ParD1/3/4
MSTTTMNISLPEALKRFVQERSKAANYSNPSDYVRALIREDQRREAAERLLKDLVEKHGPTSPAALAKLKEEYWRRWSELKADIDRVMESLNEGGGRNLDRGMIEDIKRRGRQRLRQSKPA